MMCCLDIKPWYSALTAFCDPLFGRSEAKGEHPATVMTTVSVENTETWEHHKKFTVYKVMVTSDNNSWFVFRRYNEFYKLYEMLKKQVPGVQLKLPGKKLFGNNLDPQFVQSRREGLNSFIQQIMTDTRFRHISEDGSVEEGEEETGNNDSNRLLQKDRHKRLGSGYSGFDEQSVMDLRHIDPEFTRERVTSSVGRSQSTCVLSASVREADDAFAGFSYAPPIDLQ
ncbi:hypothetical protein C0J52_07332 [Blattella germanica]|nr:hypothetical protein C0J52_07332 [Blattella germanica]